MKRRIAVVTVLVLIVGALGFWGVQRIRGSTSSKNNLQTAQVQRGSLVATISTAGTVQTTDAVNLSFQASGQVKEIKVKVGDAVKAGQEIARLDTADAEIQVAQAELSLSNAKTQLDQAKKGATAEEIAAAKASLASAEENLKALQAGPAAADVELARIKWEQAKNQLWSTQMHRDATCGDPRAAGSACDEANASVNNAELSVETARLQYEQAQQGPSDKELRAAEAQVAQAQLSLSKLTTPNSESITAAENQVKQAELSLQQAKAKLAQCSLVAPFDGTISSLDLKVGQMAGASAQVATLAGTGSLEVTANLAEVDVDKVKVGQEVDVLLDAMPERTFKGRVGDVAQTGTSTQGVVNFPVTIYLEQTDPAIRPGMTANATVVVDRRENVLLVPNRAIQVQGKQHLVRVVHEGQVIELAVEIGLSGSNGTEILGDTLREGDLLALNGATTAGATRGVAGGFGGMMLRP